MSAEELLRQLGSLIQGDLDMIARVTPTYGSPPMPGFGVGSWVSGDDGDFHVYGKVESLSPHGLWVRSTYDPDHPVFLPFGRTRIRLDIPNKPITRPAL